LFCQFPNPWTLRVSGMGGYTSNCEKKSKSLHPTIHTQYTVLYSHRPIFSGNTFKKCFFLSGGGIGLSILKKQLMYLQRWLLSSCSATATISYPASLSKLPNGCQGHPRFCPSPPDRSPITKPDSNCVLRAATFIQLLAWVDIKMHKVVEA